MSRSRTCFCDNCGKEVWGVDVIRFNGQDFCSNACIEEYMEREYIGEL